MYGTIFLFYAEKSSDDTEDADVSKLCGSAPPHFMLKKGKILTSEVSAAHFPFATVFAISSKSISFVWSLIKTTIK